MRDAALARIRLRHLQCFLAVAQFSNLRRAAQALSITQPAVTKTVNELGSAVDSVLREPGTSATALTCGDRIRDDKSIVGRGSAF
jgi:LysR family pca operon transcriptional activator